MLGNFYRIGDKEMIKKVVLGVVFAVFVGALITGAVIRTMDKSEQVAEVEQKGGGNGNWASADPSQLIERQGRRGSEGRRSVAANEGGRGGGKGNGEGSEPFVEGESDHLGEIFLGVVTEVAEDVVNIEVSDGDVIVVEGRAWSYAKENGYVLQAGDEVRLEGFYEDDEFKVSSIENLTTGESLLLRDANGRPSWAGGRGRNL
jgi:hypothetical protein